MYVITRVTQQSFNPFIRRELGFTSFNSDKFDVEN